MHKFDVVLANLRNFDFLVCDLDFTHVGALALAFSTVQLTVTPRESQSRLPLPRDRLWSDFGFAGAVEGSSWMGRGHMYISRLPEGDFHQRDSSATENVRDDAAVHQVGDRWTATPRASRCQGLCLGNFMKSVLGTLKFHEIS